MDELLDSGVLLSGEIRLALRDLLNGDFDLSAARLAVLSACQSEITEFARVPRPVKDVSAAVLMVEFRLLLLYRGPGTS